MSGLAQSYVERPAPKGLRAVVSSTWVQRGSSLGDQRPPQGDVAPLAEVERVFADVLAVECLSGPLEA